MARANYTKNCALGLLLMLAISSAAASPTTPIDRQQRAQRNPAGRTRQPQHNASNIRRTGSNSGRHLTSTEELNVAALGELAEMISSMQSTVDAQPTAHRSLLATTASEATPAPAPIPTTAASPAPPALDLQGIVSLLQNLGSIVKSSNNAQPQLNLQNLLNLLQNLGIKLPSPAGGSGGSQTINLEGVMNFLQTITQLLPSSTSGATTQATDLPGAFVNTLKSLGSLVTAVTTASNSGTTPDIHPLMDFLKTVGTLFVQLAQNGPKAAAPASTSAKA
eukprot:gene13179-13310_t